MRVVVFLGMLAVGCAALWSPGSVAPARAALAGQLNSVRKSAPARGAVLYPLDEALQDALAGTWQHLGTGSWYGNSRVHACVYRNDRVFVVNVYCTLKEPNAFRLDVDTHRRAAW